MTRSINRTFPCFRAETIAARRPLRSVKLWGFIPFLGRLITSPEGFAAPTRIYSLIAGSADDSQAAKMAALDVNEMIEFIKIIFSNST